VKINKEMSYLENLGDLWLMFEKTVNNAKDEDKSRVRARTLGYLISEIIDNSRAETLKAKSWHNRSDFLENLRKVIRNLGI